MAAILQVKNISKDFGGLKALQDVSIEIQEDEIFGLIGPNGSGKTTLYNIITGFLRADAGSVYYKGEAISGLKPYQIAERGLVRTFQITSLFGGLTAEENIIRGSYLRTRGSIWGSFFQLGSYQQEEMRLRQKAEEALDFVGIEKGRRIPANQLPAAKQRNLEIAIALASDPKLLLLDEPAGGMNPEEQSSLMSLIRSIQARGIAVGVVEHNMKLIMRLCSRIAVLNYGSKIAEGRPESITTDERVISIYLGSKRQDA